jgi:alkaline phosphatase D
MAADQASVMTFSPPVSRRFVLKGAALGAAATAAAAAPIRWFDTAIAAEPAKHGVFGYGVASGDPTGDSVIIWTRATPSPDATPGSGRGASTTVTWEVATDPRFTRVVRTGTVRTSPASDHTVKVDVDGLRIYTRYWYRFKAQGDTSPIGVTRTAPDEPHQVHALRFALVSCSNYTGGYFGPYRAIADRADLDFVLHVGDYIYEYGNGSDRYGPTELVGERDAQPATETIDLAGYRLRHALHKADPDLAEAHRRHPWVTIFDDHEVANNSWKSGAENHTGGVEGNFFTRRAQAYQAYMEWMPFRLPDQHTVAHQGTRFFRRFRFGPLADLSVLETRQNRSRQVDVAPFTVSGGGLIPVGLPGVDKRLADPQRHLPEPEQMQWLKNNVEGRLHWHLVGNQVVMTPTRFPGTLHGAPATTTLLNSDQWDGYQADQNEIITHLGRRAIASGDTVVLTGDSHSSWAMDLPTTIGGPDYTSAGVEFVCPSVTSDGFYETLRKAAPAGASIEDVVAATNAATTSVTTMNPWIKYFDGIGHGFVIVDVTPDRIQGDWYHTPTPTSADPDPRIHRDVVPIYKTSWQTVAHSRRTTPAHGRVGPRSDEPQGAAPTAAPAASQFGQETNSERPQGRSPARR